jgi:hypothetical protein
MSEEQYLTNELYWEELVRQKDARIKWLEIEVQRRAGETVSAYDRIAALEEALLELTDWVQRNPEARAEDHGGELLAIVRAAALAPEQDK